MRCYWFKGYKLHPCTTTEGIILSHVLTTANRNDAAVTPELLASFGAMGYGVCVLGDAAYNSEKVRQTSEQAGILFMSPTDRRNSKERKDAYGQGLPVLLKTRLGQWLFGLRSRWSGYLTS
ncbi:transposase [Anoxybacillus sp. P3H1B]|uniref:transposase n=1 Tax=Anoxybacillus sp. P3H1B TaxID=1769293 RepID=UPI001E5BADCA|nr:transposase [Anoxybacillus sp. P3H1B]